MSKIELQDNMMEVFSKLSEGNPGALSVLIQISESGETIDPDNFLGSLGTILMFDTYEIYGPNIWMLYKDVCNENVSKTIGLLRSCQMGIISEQQLKHAIDNYGSGLELDNIMERLTEERPAFKIEE